jgi:hypothetical protein|tara:strand:+ start:209 stop:664 length:456 start_codon:yes stop_codon:yes gene_type:complete
MISVTEIQISGEPILTGRDRHTVDDLVWSLDDNNVGHVYESEDELCGLVKYQAIGDFEDGEYGLILNHYEEVESISSDGTVTMKMEHVYYASTKKVTIKDGLVDVDSVKEATVELLNRCGYWGVFIEALYEVDFDIGLLDKKKFIHLSVGS